MSASDGLALTACGPGGSLGVRLPDESVADRLAAHLFDSAPDLKTVELRRGTQLLRVYERLPEVVHESCPVHGCNGQLIEVAAWGSRTIVLRCNSCGVVSSAWRPR